MKYKICNFCKTKYNSETTKECPVCIDIRMRMGIYGTSFQEELDILNKKKKRYEK